MQPPRARFTIRSLMVAVAGVAGVLALPRWPAWLLLAMLALCVLNLILAAMLWRAFRDFRRLAALGFGVAAASASLACAVLSIFFQEMGGLFIAIPASFLAFPLILGLGAAWASSAAHRDAGRGRSPLVAWPLVLVLAFLPLTMLFTLWPFRLAFLASESALDRLADRVAAGRAPRGPLRAGLFLVVGSAFDPSTGDIALITDADPGGRSGFIRYRLDPNIPGGLRHGPFTNLNYDLQLSDGWRYECED